MGEQLLEIWQHSGEGYQPLVDYDAWRVAVLHWEPGARLDRIESMERHMETDEVFVLLKGCARLIIGGNQAEVGDLHAEIMASGKLYNVKRQTWHTILLSTDAEVLIVENKDTGAQNTDYYNLSDVQRQELRDLSLQ